MIDWLSSALAHPVTQGIVAVVIVCMLVAPLTFEALRWSGRMNAALQRELYARYFSWLVLIPAMMLPVLAGRVPVILAVTFLSLLCLREFSLASGLSKERGLLLTLVAGILAIAFAAFDRWYGLFQAVPAIWLCLIAAVAIIPDRPEGYLHRTAVAALCLLLFGSGLGSLSYLANDADFRPILLAIFLCVELNDVFAYIVGRSLGRRPLAPRTSPNKTMAGSAGALVLTAALFATLAHFIFRGTALESWQHTVIMGMLVSIAGQFGDLVMSSIKRDLKIKDMAATIPGHGGLLDRFDSLLLVAPALFHYIHYFRGIG